jgi:hypothetical protein
MLWAAGAQAEGLKRDWKPVPNYPGVFIDVASIAHFEVQDNPAYHCRPDAPPDTCRLPPPDATADVKVDGAISKATRFYCKGQVEVGDWHFGIVGGEEHVIPMAATKKIVCGSH